MPRRYEIETAFTAAIKIEPNGRRTATTRDFVHELEKVNWHWSLSEANRWIAAHTRTFRDITDHEGEDRTWFQFNYGGGL